MICEPGGCPDPIPDTWNGMETENTKTIFVECEVGGCPNSIPCHWNGMETHNKNAVHAEVVRVWRCGYMYV